MDGTFLDNPKNYDRALFGKLLAKMKDQGVHFSVASGNQYARLQDDFRECFQEIDFVAENGAYLLGKGKEMLAQALNPKTVEKIVQFQENIKDSHPALNGIKSAYMLKSEDKDYLKSMFYYCPSHTLVDSFEKLPDDRFIKLNLAVPAEDTKQTVARLTEMFGAEVHVTSSGFGDIDIIKKGVNKAQGLETMLKRWNLTGEDLAAFGGGNDIEMLRFAKYSYAMANADPEVKKVSQYSTLSNNESGVLKSLEELLND